MCNHSQSSTNEVETKVMFLIALLIYYISPFPLPLHLYILFLFLYLRNSLLLTSFMKATTATSTICSTKFPNENFCSFNGNHPSESLGPLTRSQDSTSLSSSFCSLIINNSQNDDFDYDPLLI